jgi:hypothetical protein
MQQAVKGSNGGDGAGSGGNLKSISLTILLQRLFLEQNVFPTRKVNQTLIKPIGVHLAKAKDTWRLNKRLQVL